jgi:hypothetical protein
MLEEINPEYALIFLVISVLLVIFNKQIVEMVAGKSRRKNVSGIFMDFNSKRLPIKHVQVVRENVITNENSSITTEQGNIYFEGNNPPLRGIKTIDLGISSISDLASNHITIKLHDRNEIKNLQDEVQELKREKAQMYIQLKMTKKFFNQLMKDQFKSVAEAKKELGSSFGGFLGGGLGGFGGYGGGMGDDAGDDMP